MNDIERLERRVAELEAKLENKSPAFEPGDRVLVEGELVRQDRQGTYEVLIHCSSCVVHRGFRPDQIKGRA